MYGGNKRPRMDAYPSAAERMPPGDHAGMPGGYGGGAGYGAGAPGPGYGLGGMSGTGYGAGYGDVPPSGPLGGMAPPGAAYAGGFDPGEPPFPAVRLRGLPFDVREVDLIEWAQVGAPVDVLLVQRGGRFSGEAFVVLGDGFQQEALLHKNRTYLGRRYVEVFRARRMDYYRAVTQFMADSDTGGPPPQRQRHGSRPPPDAQPHVRHEGGTDAMQQHQPPHQPPPHQQGGPAAGEQAAVSVQTAVLRLRGLPFSSSKQDIQSWFAEICPLQLDSIHMHVAFDGRPSGQAFVEFGSPVDATAAMSMHRQMLGNRYVEIFPSSREEATRTCT